MMTSRSDLTPSRPLTPRMLTEAAYHEAGHAVIGVVLRLNVRHAEIAAVDGRVGQTVNTSIGSRYGGDWPPDELLRRHASGLIAGRLAVKLALGRYNNRGDDADMNTLAMIALHLCGRPDQIVPLIRQIEGRYLGVGT